MIVLDTNVISEMTRERPDPVVVAWLLRQPDPSLFTTAVTVAESLYGLELLPPGRRRELLTGITRQILDIEFRGKILSFDEQAAHHYSRILGARRGMGAPMTAFDAQIAAIALAAGASLATRNVSDFEDCGVALINPWNE
jgi:predicted nucleic acid-binding protein